MASPPNSPDPAVAPTPAPPSPRRWLRRVLIAAVVLALAAYLASGFVFIQPDERGVIRRFGRIVEPKAAPGLRYAWPWPIGRIDRPKTTQVKRITVGLDPETRAAIAAGDVAAQSASLESDLFTGDVNIVKATMVAQFQIDQPDLYLTCTADPDALVRYAVKGVLVETLGGYTVDDALTEGKARIQNTVRESAQGLLRRYGCGITLLSVDLESIEPPAAIAEAFRDVASAKKDREKAIDQAQSLAGSIVAKAHGAADERLAQADAYRQERVNRAKGDADVFRSLHNEYIKAPEVTRTRLLLDTLSRVYETAEVYIYTPGQTGPPLRITIEETKPSSK